MKTETAPQQKGKARSVGKALIDYVQRPGYLSRLRGPRDEGEKAICI